MNKEFLIIFFLITNICFSQTIKTEKRTVNYSDGKAFFEVCVNKLNLEFAENLEYRWHNNYSGLQKTKGGAGGEVLHGKYQAFNDKGSLKYENNYYLGLQDGVQKEWDENGDLYKTFKYKKGVRYYSKFPSDEGDYIIEYIGAILEDGTIKKVYDKYGTLLQEETDSPELRREITDYYSSGKIKSKYTTNYMNWMFGEFKTYYSNGQIECEGNYIENNRTGIWKWFKEDGSPDETEEHRVNKIKREDGTLFAEGGEYFDSEKNEWNKNGTWRWFKEDGKRILDIKIYEYGTEVEETNEK